MNKFQWKCKCCGKLKSVKKHIVSVGDVCSDCVKKNNNMYKVLFGMHIELLQAKKARDTIASVAQEYQNKNAILTFKKNNQ